MKYLASIILSLFVITSYAQECATEPPTKDVQDMFRYRNLKDNGEQRNFAVYFTVVGPENLQQGMSDALLDREISNLNKYFNGQGAVPTEFQPDVGDFNFNFRRAGTRRIIDAKERWDSYNEVAEAYNAVEPDKYINIYYLNYRFGGQSIFPSASVVGSYRHINIVNYGNRNYHTCEHEVGHFFNIRHTFDTQCGMDPCEGDGCCDTPPYCSINNCSQLNSCCGTPAGSNTHNIMSYNSCREMFTNDQKSRARHVTNVGGILRFLVEQPQGPQPTTCQFNAPPQPFVVGVNVPYQVVVLTDAESVRINYTTNDNPPKSGVYSLPSPSFMKTNSHGREITIVSQATCYNGSSEIKSEQITVSVVKGTPPPPPPQSIPVVGSKYLPSSNEIQHELEDGTFKYVTPK